MGPRAHTYSNTHYTHTHIHTHYELHTIIIHIVHTYDTHTHTIYTLHTHTTHYTHTTHTHARTGFSFMRDWMERSTVPRLCAGLHPGPLHVPRIERHTLPLA